MSVWNRKNEKYILDYWNGSSIEWQQKNREILNEAIKIYNKYVRNNASLKEVQEAIYYSEDRLKNECGSYIDDINFMKNNVDKIELERL